METIQNSNLEDKNQIFTLYSLASELQKVKFSENVWGTFDENLIETEILEQRQWKMLVNEQIACIWATTFSDAQIWEAQDADPAVYIHRIATHPFFRGQKFVQKIVTWAREYATLHQKKFIRMDTCGENTKLIQHYTTCGFEFLGKRRLNDATGLPNHYKNADVCFFEIHLSS